MDAGARKVAARALEPLPKAFAATRASLHRVAEQIVAPARKPDNEIALEATPGGFGTPAFHFNGNIQRVRVEGGELVRLIGDQERRSALTSLRAAGSLVEDLLSDGAALSEEALDIAPDAALALGDWYALGDSVLGELIAGAEAGDGASEINLWPEHFDIAIELGPEADGARANYGFSPGDDDHPEPYLYVGPWTAEVSGPLWQSDGFKGAELDYAKLVASPDPHKAALEFCLTRKQALEEDR